MSSLFVLNRSWHDTVWLFEQLAFASEGDAILLIEDATLALHSTIVLASFLAKCRSMKITVYALLDDCVLRGIDNKYRTIEMIDYSGYVELLSSYEKQVAW